MGLRRNGCSVKRAVSISLGSSKRDKCVEVELLGEKVVIERIGTDGDVGKAAALYRKLDGRVGAFGVGGTDLVIGTPHRSYRIRAAWRLIRDVKLTPVADGRNVKLSLERRCMVHIEQELGAELEPKRALVNVALDRYGMAESLIKAGYETVFGDLQFGLGIPVAVRSLRTVNVLAAVLAPLVGRFAPISMFVPIGAKQHTTVPRFTRWYNWATIIAGDCHYTRRHMPPELPGKTVLTNTTTEDDIACFREAGVRYLITTTPRYEGRSFGTNMLEAALTAVAGKGRRLTQEELLSMCEALALHPQIQRLNP